MHISATLSTKNLEQHAHLTAVAVGVDPAIAFHLQQQAYIAESTAATVIHAAHGEVLNAGQQAEQATAVADQLRIDVQQSVANASAHVSHVVSEGRTAVAAAQSDAGSARAAAAKASAERNAILVSAQAENANVHDRIVDLERQLTIERARQAASPSATQAAWPRQPARPKPPFPETFTTHGQT